MVAYTALNNNKQKIPLKQTDERANSDITQHITKHIRQNITLAYEQNKETNTSNNTRNNTSPKNNHAEYFTRIANTTNKTKY